MELVYYCDSARHLICLPYSKENLLLTLDNLNINKCWLHFNPYLHIDIPKKRLTEMMDKCIVVSSKEIVRMIKENKYE